MNLISAAEAATMKNTTRQTIAGAIKRGEIDAERLGVRIFAVKVNRKFEEWQPSKRQESGRARWASARSVKKARRTA